jgi:hypothetical protein
VLLLRGRAALDWDRLFGWLDNPKAASALYVLLSYLATRGLADIDAAVLRQARARQRFVGPLELQLTHATFDRYLVAGRRWDFPWPPPMPGRYSVRYQFEKRVLRRWARWSPV